MGRFVEYKQNLEQYLRYIQSYSYSIESSQKDIDALQALKQTCLNASNEFTGDSVDILGKLKKAIETARSLFKSRFGDAEWEYTYGTHKILKPGAKNKMVYDMHDYLHFCIFYIEGMITIKSAEERTVTHPPNFDDTPHMKMLLHRLQSYSSSL